MQLFSVLKIISREMTVNENAQSLDDKYIKKEVEEIIAQQTMNLEKLSIAVSNDNTIPRNGDFVSKQHINEGKADETARKVAQTKQEKENMSRREKQIGE